MAKAQNTKKTSAKTTKAKPSSPVKPFKNAEPGSSDQDPRKQRGASASSKENTSPRKGKSVKSKADTKSAPEAKSVVGEIVEHDDELRFGDEDLVAESVQRIKKDVSKTDSMSQKEDIEEPLSVLPSKKIKAVRSTQTATGKELATVEKSVSTTDPLLMYLNEIRRYPLLTREEETQLAEKYFTNKDPEAAQRLVKSNLRFVVKIAAEYSKFGAKMIDLIQEGNIGLLHAVKEFNPYKGARLITYAVWWIRGYIQEYLMRQYSMVRIGTTQNQRRLFYQLQKEQKALEAMGQKGDFKQLAERLDMPEDEVREMAQRMGGRDLSLDRPLDDDSEASLMDFQKSPSEKSPDQELELNEQLHLLREKIDSLRPSLNEKEIILLDERLLADEPLTLQEIGEKYKITREAVRQSEVRLMNKIKALVKPDSE